MDAVIAVDVAILPPQSVSEMATQLNALLPAAESKGLRLDAAHLPHVTLTQQFVNANAAEDVANAVATVLRGRAPLPLRIAGPGRGSSSVWMQIDRTPALLDLHRDLMNALKPFERTGGTRAAFVDGDARPGDLQWVSGFRRTSSFTRYQPHITLGHATGLPPVPTLDFSADTVALCRLGRFCACREILASWRLAGL